MHSFFTVQLLSIFLQCGRTGFDAWVGKIPWRRDRLCTRMGWRIPWTVWSMGSQELDSTERLSLHSLPYMTFGKTIALTIQTLCQQSDVLLFNTLSRFVIAFLLRSKRLLISWLQSPSTVILEPKKIKSVSLHVFPICFRADGFLSFFHPYSNYFLS